MARYNSVNSTSSVAGGNSITTPYSGLLTTLTGSGTVTVPNPVYYTGQIQTFYNSTLSAITLSTPSGSFISPGFTSAGTISIASVAIITIVSDGTNYLVQDWLGGIGSYTSLTASGGTVNLNGTTTGSIDNVIIGGTTAKAGTFNGLTNTAGTTSLAGGSASGVFSFTSNQASTAYNNGAIVVTGGAGIGGNLYVNGNSVVGTYGTPTTGAGFRTNTTDIYGQTAAVDKIRLSITGDSWFMGGKVGIGNTAPAAHVHNGGGGTPTGIGNVPGNVYHIQDATTNNFMLFRNTADNTTYSGIAMQDNNIGGYVVYGNGGASDCMFIAGYSGVQIQQGTADSISPTARTTIGNFSSTGLAVTGQITSTGNIYSSYSDLRLKNVIKPIENSLENLAKIDTFYYEPNDLAKSLGVTGGITIGVSTQSVKLVYPEIVGPSPVNKDYDTVQYEKLVPVLIDAINRLNSKIEYLESKLKDQ